MGAITVKTRETSKINEAPPSICEKCTGDKKNLCGIGKDLNCIHGRGIYP